MPLTEPAIVNIALVGGGALCTEVLEKTTFDYMAEGVRAPILAVADSNPDSPGMLRAKKLGLLTFQDHHELYDRRYSIHLIIILTPQPGLLEEILATRPARIRIMSHHVFEIFWKVIGTEERKLREQKSAMETILNGIQDFILVITPQMEIIEANEAFLKHTGHSREEVIGRKCHEVYERLHHQCDDPFFTCPLEEVIRQNTPIRQVRTRQHETGGRRHFEVNVYPIWEKSGRISRFIHISRDITQRLKEEEEITQRLEAMVEERTRQLKESHAKLLHQDKMASLGKLSASVVHEINNPIAGILNLVLLIKRMLEEGDLGTAAAQPLTQYLKLMETETRRISRIVSNLLAFSRQSKVEPQPLNLNQLLEKTLVLNANLLKLKGIQVTKALEPRLPEIEGTEDQLQQVFMNIIINAAEAMESAEVRTLSITTRFVPHSDKVQVAFADTGIGIRREEYGKLFEPFYTTKKDGKGVGLGLSVAYGIVREHGGSVYVEAASPGTIFKVSLPLKQKAHRTEAGETLSRGSNPS